MPKRKTPSSCAYTTVEVRGRAYDVLRYPWTLLEERTGRTYEMVEVIGLEASIVFLVDSTRRWFYHPDHVVETEGRTLYIPEDSPRYGSLKECMAHECIGVSEDVAEAMEEAFHHVV